MQWTPTMHVSEISNGCEGGIWARIPTGTYGTSRWGFLKGVNGRHTGANCNRQLRIPTGAKGHAGGNCNGMWERIPTGGNEACGQELQRASRSMRAGIVPHTSTAGCQELQRAPTEDMARTCNGTQCGIWTPIPTSMKGHVMTCGWEL